MQKVETSSTNIENILITTYKHPNGHFHASAECTYDKIHQIAISDDEYDRDIAIREAVSKLISRCVPIIEFIE